ncbi:hypothetical protein ACLB2K_066642 [Fragaria x ananassa]
MLSELLNLEVNMSEEDKVSVLLVSLLEKYDQLVTTMLYEKQSIVLDEVTSTLLSNENRRKVVDVNYEDSRVFSARGRRENRDQGWKSSKSNSGYHKDKECYYCHEKGHTALHCPKLKKKKDEGNEKNEDCHQRVSANFISDYGDCVIMATSHSGKAFKVEGIGAVKIKTHDGLVRILGDVRYVPNLRWNLISVGALDFKGYKIVTEGGVLKVMMDSRVVLREIRWQPKLQQSLEGGKPVRTSMTLARGNSDGNKLAHYGAIKVSSRRAVGHVGDSQKRSILNCGEEMTFVDQLVVSGRLEKVACGNVKPGSENDVGRSLQFDKVLCDDMLVAAQEGIYVKFEEFDPKGQV